MVEATNRIGPNTLTLAKRVVPKVAPKKEKKTSPLSWPARPWKKEASASVDAPKWWAVRWVLKKKYVFQGGFMFRQPTREAAEREAQFLAEANPGELFVVLEVVSRFQVEKPKMGEINVQETHQDRHQAKTEIQKSP